MPTGVLVDHLRELVGRPVGPPHPVRRSDTVAPVDDRAAITELTYRYASCIDSGDLDGVADLFEHGHMCQPTGEITVQGRDEVRRAFDTVILYDDGTPRTHHVITNSVIDLVDGADEATGSCYVTVVQGIEKTGPIEVILVGRYTDKYRRTANGWEFAERCFQADMKGDLSRHTREDLL
jgi:ketosteroid isomerase-like protein